MGRSGPARAVHGHYDATSEVSNIEFMSIGKVFDSRKSLTNALCFVDV
jgi:hypothetical protein